MNMHEMAHKAVEQSPNPVAGAVGGATAGAVVGTVAFVKTYSLVTVIAAVKVFGIAAVATAAAPAIGGFALCVGGAGLLYGTKNWLQNRRH